MRAGQKKNTCVFVNALPKSNARSSEVEKKKYSSLNDRRFFFKTNHKKVKRRLHFEGSKVFFCCPTKCYFAQCLPFNLTKIDNHLYMLGCLLCC